MDISAESLGTLLAHINGGQAAEALPEVDQLLTHQPGHPGLLTLRAEALRLTGHVQAAVEAFKRAGESGAGSRSWLIAGILLTSERNIGEALKCLQRALEETPDNEEVLDALITTLFNSSRHSEGIELARRQLTLSSNPNLMSRAALLLQGNDLYEESTAAFRKIIALAPNEPAFAGSALVPTRFTCDWDYVEQLQRQIKECYQRGDFGTPQEYPLTNITWCADEAWNLGVTRAYVARMVARVEAHVTRRSGPAGGRIRVGYLSCDFRNHATMHLMAGLLEAHDRQRFEVFAYDYSSHDISEYRQRFLNAVEHHVPIHSLTDQLAAERIAQDQVDILFDLKLYTGGGRAGIMAYRPAPIQAAYLGFPGSAASTDIDYIVSDRFVTPDSSAPHYPEKFCRLPHSYQCNDRQRFIAPEPGSRLQYGLPEDKVVFGAFNQSYKIDRGSFSLWLRILTEVPDSVLWLLGQSPAAIANLTRHTQLAGVDPDRLVFAPFAQPSQHHSRLRLADAVLDALVCNGHTTTSDALWAGVPVITARGRHFASRVSESLLNAMELPELVGADADDMVRIAKHIGTDAAYRTALRAKVAASRGTAPLFDTARHTRDFETGIELMVGRYRRGLGIDHIDVPDCGPVERATPTPGFVGRVSALQTAYTGCPLCEGSSLTLGFANCTAHPLWHEPLPISTEWMRCASCGHAHTRHHWTEAGLAEVASNLSANPSEWATTLEIRRADWAPSVAKVVALLGGFAALFNRPDKPLWVDAGTGDGTLVMTAVDHGFAAIGLDTRSGSESRIRELGFNAMQADFMTLQFEVTPDVLSMMDVLQEIPQPRAALRKAAQILPPGGLLVLRVPDMNASTAKALDATQSNPNWTELTHHHSFGRDRLVALLRECEFEVVDFALVQNGKAGMELYAKRTPRATGAEGHPPIPRDAPGRDSQVGAFQIVQIRPPGYVHAEALTEIAECVHFGLRRLGVRSFYRTPPDCPVRQIVLGAHLLDAQGIAALPADAIIYNSEQIDDDSKWLTSQYVAALKTRLVWDYSTENVRRLKALGARTIDFVPVGYVPELARIPVVSEEIDVLFYGSVNARRQQILDELKARGLNVVVLFGTYGEERDRAIARAKVVLIVHYYPAKIFEVVRAAYLLTNGKAVVAEGGPDTFIEPQLRESMYSVPYERLVDACVELVRDPARRIALGEQAQRSFALRSEEQILASSLHLAPPRPASDPIAATGARLPATLQLGSGKDFKADCLNIDINPAWGPDGVFDVSSPALIGSTIQTRRFGPVTLMENSFEAAIAFDVLEHISDLTTAMSNILRLLKPGGIFHILVPYDLSLGAWQDPTHVRAFNERSWLYYTDWHWYLGWIDARFDNVATEVQMSPLGSEMQSAGKGMDEILRTPRAVDALRVRLRKRYLQESERLEAVRRQPGPQSLKVQQ